MPTSFSDASPCKIQAFGLQPSDSKTCNYKILFDVIILFVIYSFKEKRSVVIKTATIWVLERIYCQRHGLWYIWRPESIPTSTVEVSTKPRFLFSTDWLPVMWLKCFDLVILIWMFCLILLQMASMFMFWLLKILELRSFHTHHTAVEKITKSSHFENLSST